MLARPFLAAILVALTVGAHAQSLSGPAVTAKSAVVIDGGTGEVLWSKDGDTPRFPASTTKIMTALLLLEHCKPDDIIVAPKDIEKVKESSMHLKPGEKVTAHDMLYALLLRSANDGCVAVADHIAGSVTAFAAMMNARAKELGCLNTHFHNPNGLNDAYHTVSAHDLALIAREAMRRPEFRAVVKMRRYKITRSLNQKDLWMVSKNKWLRKDPTADGIKTGWTIPAGHCYVGSATRDGFRVITVVMKSEHWQDDHSRMLHWAFSNFKPAVWYASGAAIATADTPSGRQVSVLTNEPIYTLYRIGTPPQQPEVHLNLDPELSDQERHLVGPVSRGQVVGVLAITDPSSRFTFNTPAIASEAMSQEGQPTPKKKGNRPLNLPTLMVGGLLAGGAMAMRGKARKMRLNGQPPSSPN